MPPDLTVRLPAHGWHPRPHQLPLWRALQSGKKRAIEIAHRRWGKDDVCLHWTARAMHTRVGSYWHCLPEYAQARKAIWTAVNPHTGRRRIDEAFPLELRESTNDHEMFIRFKVGSTWQVIGSDRYDKQVGSSPAGLVLSEWALSVPAAWAYFAPILAENDGWAIFITTSRGRNHAKSMLDMARTKPEEWFAEVSTVADTKAITLEAVELQRSEYHAIFGVDEGDALIEQEYFCSFDAAVLGSYYGKELSLAEKEGRVCDLEIEKSLPIQTAWDIGIDDAMAIWIYQVAPDYIHFLDYFEANGYDFPYYARWLEERGYCDGTDYVPPDAKARMLGGQSDMPRTRIEALLELNRKPEVIPAHKVADGILASRRLIKRSRFDRRRCAKGLDALREYRREWDDDKRVYKQTPLHNWASHGADAYRTAAMSPLVNPLRPEANEPKPLFVPQNTLTMDQFMQLEDVKQRERV